MPVQMYQLTLKPPKTDQSFDRSTNDLESTSVIPNRPKFDCPCRRRATMVVHRFDIGYQLEFHPYRLAVFFVLDQRPDNRRTNPVRKANANSHLILLQ